MSIKDLNESQVIQLRNEITLNSLFLGDYKNSFGIDVEEVCNFFDSFLSWAYDKWKENHTEKAKCEITDLDTYVNLREYFNEYRLD